MSINEHKENEDKVQSPGQMELPLDKAEKEKRSKEMNMIRKGFYDLFSDIANGRIELDEEGIEILISSQPKETEYARYFKGVKRFNSRTTAFAIQSAIVEVGDGEPIYSHNKVNREDMFYKIKVEVYLDETVKKDVKPFVVHLKVKPEEANKMPSSLKYDRVEKVEILPYV